MENVTMACIIVPMTEAIITTIAAIDWLNKLLWGGSALLAFEHIWHGEITPVFPFLTAATDAASRAAMLHEMATSGVAMSVLVTAVWGCMVAVVSRIHQKKTAACMVQKEVQQL